MRLRDYAGEEADIEIEESGMVGLVGLGGWERLGKTYFAWRQGEPYQTAGVELDFGPDTFLSADAAHAILQRLGLPVRVGASVSELISIFGSPAEDRPGRLGTRLLDFICGGSQQYRLGCVVDNRNGLVSLFLARKDYWDEEDSL